MKISKHMRRGLTALAGGTMACAMSVSAMAGSNDSANYYSADSHSTLPTGTFIFQQYAAVTTSNERYDFAGNKVAGKNNIDAFTTITRVNYLTELFGNRLVLSAALGFGNIYEDEARFSGNPTGRPNVKDGLADPALFFSYFLLRDVAAERWLVTTHYFYLPIGRRYDDTADINVSTPNQFTWVPQIVYAEGLGKYGLKGLYVDLLANMSIHDDGDEPLTRGGGAIRYGRTTQDNTYNLQAHLTYKFNPLSWISVGVEKSWGGEQFAVDGNATANALLGPKVQIGETDYLRGHLGAAMALSRDLQLAGRLSHDFEREGSYKQDIIAELRLTKLFVPTPAEEPLK